jgi:hypothetical protein
MSSSSSCGSGSRQASPSGAARPGFAADPWASTSGGSISRGDSSGGGGSEGPLGGALWASRSSSGGGDTAGNSVRVVSGAFSGDGVTFSGGYSGLVSPSRGSSGPLVKQIFGPTHPVTGPSPRARRGVFGLHPASVSSSGAWEGVVPSRPQGGEGEEEEEEEEEEEKGEGCGGLVLPSNADIAANSKGLGSEPVRVHVCVPISSCGCV